MGTHHEREAGVADASSHVQHEVGVIDRAGLAQLDALLPDVVVKRRLLQDLQGKRRRNLI